VWRESRNLRFFTPKKKIIKKKEKKFGEQSKDNKIRKNERRWLSLNPKR
jgi:hypothetical protein